jgi:tetratricopeptide (TPR) repeat protein
MPNQTEILVPRFHTRGVTRAPSFSASGWRIADVIRISFLWLLLVASSNVTQGAPFEDMALDRWAKLREAERFQLNIAEKYYREGNWKFAADEYEKFLKLYEKSEGASYAQLKWSHCQVHLRRQNTAIKDGYQSVIDYFPESPEAKAAGYLIGKTYKDVGDLKAAKKAYAKVLKSYPKDSVAVFTRLDLVEIAGKENSTAERVALLQDLVYASERKGDAAAACVAASQQLAQHMFQTGDFGEGLKSLATSYAEDTLPARLMHPAIGRLPIIVQGLTAGADETGKKRGQKVADEAVVYFRSQAKGSLADEKTKARGVQCLYYAADIQEAAGRPDKQREVYEEMLKTLGSDDRLLGQLAQWYKTNNQRDQARATYLKFQDPVEGQRMVAQSFIEEKKFDPAIEIFRKLALADAKEPGRWLVQVAGTYRKAGKPDQAIAIYRELLSSDAKNAEEHHWSIATTLFEANRWKDALTAYRGTDRFPQNYQQMAMCNRHLKQFNEAVILYQQIIAGHPPSASWAALQIAYTQEHANAKEAAIKAFKNVCDRYPKTQEGSTAHEHLNRVYKISVTLGGAKD